MQKTQMGMAANELIPELVEQETQLSLRWGRPY